ncbi:YgfZ/GcvT domain-containing protein [Microbacterium sp. NPDC078428]|uniref:CAF17-like 4Fe-4S cluster assembly/insertion protein YgfZ n=1 Tax=Microbacterium sp. NPDC078428 TaxID=3364190 RepID=UPI0037C7BAD8
MGSPFAALPGAVMADGSAAPAHYGAPLREQALLDAGEALVHAADRAVVEVAGEDRLTWLDSITSQALGALEPGRSTELLVLDPHGHIEHAASVVDDGERAWLIVDADGADTLVAWLRRMVFRSRVSVERRDDLAVVGYARSESPAARAVLEHGAPVATWRDPWDAVSVGGHQYAVVVPHPGAGREWHEAIVTEGGLAVLAASGIAAAGLLAAEALRIAAWRPRRANEVDARTLPHELDWLRTAVHLNKGCYRGQETVAKVHNLGHPPRRLVFLHLDGSDTVLPGPGAVVTADGAEVGRITSSALHHEDGPIALAVVKRSLAVDAPLQALTDDGPVAASQQEIVPRDAGAAASVPRLPRLSSRARG